jgi:hypothetical protein
VLIMWRPPDRDYCKSRFVDSSAYASSQRLCLCVNALSTESKATSERGKSSGLVCAVTKELQAKDLNLDSRVMSPG